MYDPQARQWSQSFANSKTGVLTAPLIGNFKDERGELFAQDTLDGRSILVRTVWSDITPDAHHFEESYSDDGGKSWAPAFIASLTRAPQAAPSRAAPSQVPTASAEAGATPGGVHDGWQDFDFDIGTWKTRSSRLLHPLTGAKKWINMKGVTVVRPVWGGRANLAELDSDGPTGRLQLISLRLYDPRAHQWSLNFATSEVGVRSVPMSGEFKDGRGVFYDQEPYHGRSILVRFTMIPLSSTTARSEQAFSDDGGKTWETNWVNRYTRVTH